jgi:hypothetical protein
MLVKKRQINVVNPGVGPTIQSPGIVQNTENLSGRRIDVKPRI